MTCISVEQAAAMALIRGYFPLRVSDCRATAEPFELPGHPSLVIVLYPLAVYSFAHIVSPSSSPHTLPLSSSALWGPSFIRFP